MADGKPTQEVYGGKDMSGTGLRSKSASKEVTKSVCRAEKERGKENEFEW